LSDFFLNVWQKKHLPGKKEMSVQIIKCLEFSKCLEKTYLNEKKEMSGKIMKCLELFKCLEKINYLEK
jgi:hypothetical protein